jgi:hypothetical protein
MTRRALALFPLLAPAVLLGGCTPHDMTFGGALRTDIALQVKDPDPAQADRPQRGSGDQAAAAAERYRKGTVRQPVAQQTTQASNGGSGGGSGAGSSGSTPN